MIESNEFRKRRKQIAKIIGHDSIAIIAAKGTCIRNGDAEYKYRPDSNFYYLSGCHEPNSLMVICPESDEGDDILFCQEINKNNETWNGPMLGLENAKHKLGFNRAYDIKSIDRIMPQLMQGRDKVYFMLGMDSDFDKRVVDWTHKVFSEKWAKSQAPHELISLKPFLDDMRVYKSKEEIKCLQKSADIAALGHVKMMQTCQPNMYEYQLNAEFMHTITYHNSSPSYLPIIGGGRNACILHYVKNNEKLIDGDLVLIDAGAEYDYYASDITRTFPVNGTFSKAQAEIYQIVLDAQTAALAKAKVGCHYNEFHDAAVKVITQGLLDLGLLTGDLKTNIEENSYIKFYMHKTGHWLGLDVHDCGEYSVDGLWVELEPNMVITIEPGIYISHDAKVPKKYRGIGVRIEDDVLITSKGNKVLSENVPKSIADIEEIMRKPV